MEGPGFSALRSFSAGAPSGPSCGWLAAPSGLTRTTLPFQAIVRDDDSLSVAGGGSAGFAGSVAFGAGGGRKIQSQVSPTGCFIALFALGLMLIGTLLAILFAARGH